MFSPRLHSLLLALALVCFGSSVSRAADAMEKTPEELENVDLVEKLGNPIPLDLVFKDETGAPIRLADYMSESHLPVILTFNYSNCPMLCGVQLGGLVDVMASMRFKVGEQFRILTISLDPTETHQRAMETKLSYLERIEGGRADEGWRFVTGADADIRAVADAVGFSYRYHPERKEYLHPSALILLSPQGKVTSYTYGVKYDPELLSEHLVSAGLGNTTESVEKFILSCFHYVEPTGVSAVVAKIMRYGGLIFVFGLVAAIGIFGFRRSQLSAETAHPRSSEEHV